MENLAARVRVGLLLAILATWPMAGEKQLELRSKDSYGLLIFATSGNADPQGFRAFHF